MADKKSQQETHQKERENPQVLQAKHPRRVQEIIEIDKTKIDQLKKSNHNNLQSNIQKGQQNLFQLVNQQIPLLSMEEPQQLQHQPKTGQVGQHVEQPLNNLLQVY